VSVADDYRAAVQLLREWGFGVVEWTGCYGRSNGSGWSAGRPVGHVNHHYVCSLNGEQSYIDSLVQSMASGTVVNWFADVHGVAYLVGTGPMNHAGTGNQSVLDRTRADLAPLSNPAPAAGSISGNAHYSGTECQHPGDSTPWPAPLLDVMVAINAAEFLVWNYTANRAINHSEWSNRKVDLSAGGGVNSGGWSAAELRRRVAARMTGTEPTDDGNSDVVCSVVIGNTLNVFAISDGRVFQQWPDPGQPGGWSGWVAGIPGEWSGGLSVTFDPAGGSISVFGYDAGGTVQQVWSAADGWHGPVPFAGITVD
jgi:hypothetical protein